MYVLIEAPFSTTVWCRRILSGLKAEARKKRVNLNISFELPASVTSGEDRQLVIIGANEKWMRRTVGSARAMGIHPIVLGQIPQSTLGDGVSTVSADTQSSMYAILSHLRDRGRGRTALFAVNPNSLSDICRKDAFLSSGGKEEDTFSNEGSLDTCFDAFYRKHLAHRYQSVVCTNDFAAISLIRHLKRANEDVNSLHIVSYSSTLISGCFSPTITTVMMNFESFGQLAFMIADCLSKSEVISGIHMRTDWKMIHRETSDTLSSPDLSHFLISERSGESDGFYTDPELREMMQVENLLSECDTTDLSILRMLLDGKKQAEIEEACFLTETAVKYRIRKMKDICGCTSRAELCRFLSEYISDPSCLLSAERMEAP
ncbi:MAG: hypothetical protein IJY39_01685 [Clostridia bacterium]|nr:hypothetical protein [Clostridia bacterium]